MSFARGKSLRSLARTYCVTHRALRLRILNKYGLERYKLALSRSSSVMVVSDAIAELPAKKRAEAETWLQSNMHHLLELDSQHPVSNCTRRPEGYKVNLIEAIVPNRHVIPY